MGTAGNKIECWNAKGYWMAADAIKEIERELAEQAEGVVNERP